MKARQTTDSPEVASRFDRALTLTVEALEESGVRYMFIGGIAASGLGRPRSTHDIDVFVRPEDAELALRALSRKGFRTERTDPEWLFKAHLEGVVVDIIFKSKGDIYLDPEMIQRIITAEYHGKRIRLVSPEDLIIIKAVAHNEACPGHWHDSLALLSHASLDWDYLIRRARKAPRRILSLLLYAQSSDIWVPNRAVRELYSGLFADSERMEKPAPLRPVYQVGHLRERLAQDPRIHELDIGVDQLGSTRIRLRGQVTSEERRQAVVRVASEVCPGFEILDELEVPRSEEPSGAEEMR